MLSEAQIGQYRRDGYVVIHGLLREEELAALLAEIERASAGSTLASHDQTKVEMEPDQPPAGTWPRRLYEPCTQIGSVVEWHQDLAFYPLTNSDSLAILIYLDTAIIAIASEPYSRIGVDVKTSSPFEARHSSQVTSEAT